MTKYPFEKIAFKKVQLDYQANLQVLNDRLNTNGKDLGVSDIGYKIKTLLAVFNGNIEWYIRKIRWERIWLGAYNATSILLIIFIPFLLLYFTHFVESLGDVLEKYSIRSIEIDKKSFEYYLTMIVAILTSLLGLHKTVTSWVAKRQLLSVFHEASSGLKARFYAFEDEWNSKDFFIDAASNDVTSEFDGAIEMVIREGREIANSERMKYYEAIQNPQIDLSSILTNSFSQASQLVKGLQSKRFERMLEESEERQRILGEVRVLEAKLNLLRERLQDVEDDLVRTPGEASLTLRRSDLQKQIDAVELELVQKKLATS